MPSPTAIAWSPANSVVAGTVYLPVINHRSLVLSCGRYRYHKPIPIAIAWSPANSVVKGGVYLHVFNHRGLVQSCGG